MESKLTIEVARELNDKQFKDLFTDELNKLKEIHADKTGFKIDGLYIFMCGSSKVSKGLFRFKTEELDKCIKKFMTKVKLNPKSFYLAIGVDYSYLPQNKTQMGCGAVDLITAKK